MHKKVSKRATRRSFRVRNALRLVNRSEKMRVTVFRSNRYISVQIIDDVAQKTVLSLSSRALNATGDKSAQAKMLGIECGKQALAQNITAVLFDRGSYLYHGRVKALADGLREGGLQF